MKKKEEEEELMEEEEEEEDENNNGSAASNVKLSRKSISCLRKKPVASSASQRGTVISNVKNLERTDVHLGAKKNRINLPLHMCFNADLFPLDNYFKGCS